MNASTTSGRGHILAAMTVLIFAVTSDRHVAAQDQPPMPRPTKEHKLLKFDVGTWDATMKIWPYPGATPIEGTAVERNVLLPGGFWLLSRFDGKMGDMKFNGAGTFGYDPIEKKFTGTWIDSMSPHMLTMKGDYDEATQTLTMMGENREPNGKMQKSKEIAKSIDENTRHFEMHMQGDDGQYFQMMEINYKRRPKEKAK